MMIHMKPGQWDFFWDWHVESPDLTLADMLRIIREEKESAEAEEAAAEEADTEAWNLTQEGMAAAEEEDQRLAVAERAEADAEEAEAMAALLEERLEEMRASARASRAMAERLRLQIEAPAEERPKQTWMERFREQKKWGDMWYDQAGSVSITPVTSHRD